MRRKRVGKHDFQNNVLRFDMHKIVAGIEQTEIVRTGQGSRLLLVFVTEER